MHDKWCYHVLNRIRKGKCLKGLIGKTGEMPARSRHCNAEWIQRSHWFEEIGKAGGARKQSQENCLFCTTVWPTSDRKVCLTASPFDVHLPPFFYPKGWIFDFLLRHDEDQWSRAPFAEDGDREHYSPSRSTELLDFSQRLMSLKVFRAYPESGLNGPEHPCMWISAILSM